MQVLVIGAGNFGATVAVQMAAKKCEVVVIDNDSEKLAEIKDHVGQVIVGDATDKSLIEKFSKEMDVVVVSLGEIIDASILITHHLKEAGVKRIIAKAASRDHGQILKIIGATQVVFPERDEAIRLVTNLISPHVLDVVKLSEDLNLVEVAVPESFVGKSMRNMDLRKKYGIQILAIKNPLDGSTQVLPSPDYIFQADDIIIVIGELEGLDRFSGSAK
ncbi:MAG: TrkA family potassium uptake protein [Candidatus Omnitrophica bacterium]|nr:TrkA family potassium uptake protein [Candidatus Omnitrophota bacterium]